MLSRCAVSASCASLRYFVEAVLPFCDQAEYILRCWAKFCRVFHAVEPTWHADEPLPAND